MTEHPPDYQTTSPTEQTVEPRNPTYQQLCQGFSQNSILYGYLSHDMVRFLPGSRPQAIEGALNMMCVSMQKTPLESLVLIHEFLRNYTSIMQHETGSEQGAEAESPFLGREA